MGRRIGQEEFCNRIENAVESILEDLSRRKGLGNKWDELTFEQQEEIQYLWHILIYQSLTEDN